MKVRLSLDVPTSELFLYREVDLPFVVPGMSIELLPMGDCTGFDEVRLPQGAGMTWNIAENRLDCVCELVGEVRMPAEDLSQELKKRGWGNPQES